MISRSESGDVGLGWEDGEGRKAHQVQSMSRSPLWATESHSPGSPGGTEQTEIPVDWEASLLLPPPQLAPPLVRVALAAVALPHFQVVQPTCAGKAQDREAETIDAETVFQEQPMAVGQLQ